METDLQQIIKAVASAMGDCWRFEPGRYDHFCHLVDGGGLTLWARTDPSKPSRLIIRCDNVQALDTNGHTVHYAGDGVPSITVAASRNPASITADIRSRLLPAATAWYTEAMLWKKRTDGRAAVVASFRGQLLTLAGARSGHDQQKIYATGWECEPFADRANITFRNLTHGQTLALLRAYTQITEQPMPDHPKHATQDHMFPSGDDLPLFSETPVKATARPFSPAPVAPQPSLLDLRPQFGGQEPQYQPTQETPEELN